MKYKILAEKTVFDNYFKIKKATIQHDTFEGKTIEVERMSFERGNSVAIVLYEKDTAQLLFTQQFRYPTVKEADAWILEITAGTLEKDDNAEDRIRKEVEEELGYTLQKVELISSFFVSPGGSSEQVFLYYGEVDTKDKKNKGGGAKDEKEDIQLIKIPETEIANWLEKNKFKDAKTIIGLQWFLNNRLKKN